MEKIDYELATEKQINWLKKHHYNDEEGLKIMRSVADNHNMAVASEIMDVSQLDLFMRYADILKIGARNMQNFNLLKEVGKIHKPVILKRGLSATYEEWLMSAEYIMANGNNQVILCERGIRTFEKFTRNTLDLCAIPVIKKMSHLPIIIDPSHATGLRDKVEPMSLAAIAAGCDGLIIEVLGIEIYNNVDIKPDMVEYRGHMFNKADLSPETIEWLEWYNELSETEQLAISYIPHEIQKFLD